MPDDERKEGEEPEEDEFARRFREIEERARQISEKARAPEPPTFTPASSAKSEIEPKPERKGPPEHATRGMGIALAVGYSFVGPILAGIIVGSLIDGKTGGTWTIVGILLGTIVAFVLLIRLVNRLNG